MREYGKRDPSSHRTPEQIHKMDAGYNHVHSLDRSERNKARRIMTHELGKKALIGKDVDHKKMVIKGGTNTRANLRLQTPHKNRGWERAA